MGGIGHKAPPGLLRCLEPSGQAVEFRRDLGNLVRALHHRPVAVRALPHLGDGLQKLADTPGKHPRQQYTDADNRHRHHCGNGHNILLQVLQQRPLLRVILIGVYHPDDLTPIHHRSCSPAQKSLPVKGAVKGIIPLQCLGDLRVKGILSPGVLLLPGVIKHPPGGVRDHHPADTGLLQAGQSLFHISLRQAGEPRQGRLHNLYAAAHRGFLGPKYQVLRLDKRISVQNRQHDNNNGEIAQADLKL